MAFDPKQVLDDFNLRSYLGSPIRDMYPDKPVWRQNPYDPPLHSQKKTWDITCITGYGIVQIEVTCKGLPEPYIQVAVPRPVKEADPRLHWDEHVSGMDITMERVQCKRYAGTVYIQEGLL